ncbi:MAG: bifunctional GNAT family N-acetyltransferase/carbon-nitrogen hydrolase family protein [Bacteroidia bacterium]|jgi:predicted amidohydrolase/ribosomal protein S18 acetylase RimI-like enzyme|nr:bifunctional GNAT family N-acetyltransferase/carbon-nitrogen hydrolase family protein [Bacteroidia bacterium]
MKKIKVRRLKPSDYETIIQIQLACFPDMKPWTKEQFNSVLHNFPQGQLGVEYEGSLVASSCSHIIQFDDYSETSSWGELTNHGMITNHYPKGDTLYGIEIMVAPEFRNMKLSRRLYAARQKLVKDRNLKRIAIGGRIPNYYKYADKWSAEEYVEKVLDKKIYDPVLTAQLANGFVLKRLLPNYLPNDKESCGYATFLEWPNFQYKSETVKHRTNPYVRVCAIQYQMRMIKNFEEFAQNCEYFVDVASDYRCDIVLFPEMLTMQLLTFLPNKSPGSAIRSLNNFTTKYVSLFTELAIKYNINIIGGSHFAIENDNLYNISYLFRRDGSVEKQYKLHITPHEKKWWGVKPGNTVEVFDTDCGKISILICYDVEFPELARIAVNKGAQVIFVPFNTDERRGYLRVRYCAQARAIENQVYMVLAGCVGNIPAVENMDIHYAQSAVFTPSDVEFHREGIATEAPANNETLIFQDLDLDLLNRNREYGSVQTLKDRRKDLYSITYLEGNKKFKV